MVLVPRGTQKQRTSTGRSEPGTLICGRRHYMESGHGEREEIGRCAQVSFWKAKLAEHYDPDGHKNPEREAEASRALQSIGLERIR